MRVAPLTITPSDSLAKILLPVSPSLIIRWPRSLSYKGRNVSTRGHNSTELEV